MTKPTLDHTGEIWHNRKITGWADFKKTQCGKVIWAWKWECIDCGATGQVSEYRTLKRHAHICDEGWRSVEDGKHRTREYFMSPPYRPPEPPLPDPEKVCGKQCQECGHFDGRSCLYLLDTGHRRPKVKLNKEPCPVRDTEFRRSCVTLTFGFETAEAQADMARRIWNKRGNGA